MSKSRKFLSKQFHIRSSLPKARPLAGFSATCLALPIREKGSVCAQPILAWGPAMLSILDFLRKSMLRVEAHRKYKLIMKWKCLRYRTEVMKRMEGEIKTSTV